ncbi:hypothetical protein QTG54_014114 [Skeletonema marinoi]|uniref:Uncharacterized protein n=1 Tax=Skeletonema marinoi TaxID=267567 RepID=A0AAD8XX59_9STRA|nr:hypothetical protein QTG54_014114 [Skeletonema marinoi]
MTNSSLATIPNYTSQFPRMEIQCRVEECLARYKLMTTEIGSSHNVVNNDTTSSFAAAELIALLGSDNTTGNNGGPAGIDIGKYLSDPTNILNLTTTTTGNTNNEALKQQLIQSANTTTNNTNNNTAPTACVTINNQLTALIPPISREGSSKNGSSAVLVATDQLVTNGLVDNLIKTVRELTGVMEGIANGLRNGGGAGAGAASTTTAATPPGGPTGFGTGLFGSTTTTTAQPTSTLSNKKKNLDMEYALLGFTQMQRQIASECLFYLAYHTQLTVGEVTSIIDLVKELTNGSSGGGGSSGLPLLDPLLMDVPSPYLEDGLTTTTMMGGESHGPNSFGVGNALFPPQTHFEGSSGSGVVNSPALTAIHSRLDPNSQTAEESWKRRDVWGILLISYALLLRPAASQLVSPRGGSSSSPQQSGFNRSPPLGGGGSGGVDVKSTFSKCLMVAKEWYDEELNLAKVNGWRKIRNVSLECGRDMPWRKILVVHVLMMLVRAIGVSVVLAPSRCLRMLDLIQAESDSALFVYLSFLSSLALSGGTDGTEASNGASMVHSFLSGNRTMNNHSERHMHFNWNNALSAIRWYAEQLSPEEGDDSSKKVSSDRIRRSNSTSDTTESSSTYYYGAGGSSSANTSGDNSSANSPIRQGTSSSSYSSGKDTKRKELDEVGRSTLMSLLCLISNVATRSAAAREFILSIQLPAMDSDGTGASYLDGSLEILFSLLTVPIPPEIQGLAFMAIANLIRSRPTEGMPKASGESKKSQAALRAWELLEICQFVPIKLLSQYSSYAAGTSATTSMSTFGRQQNHGTSDLPATCFPQSSEYMMIYQFEHVEAEVGTYPATEGFLFLLSTLVKYAGCPSNLGSQWRLRPGCAPYIEYVTDFVLPRATGMSKNVKTLPFASVADECRLINRAMEVVEAVLVRYVVPPMSEKKTFDEIKAQYSSNVNAARVELGLAPIIPEIFCSAEDIDEEDMAAAIQDFRNEMIYSQEDGGMNATGQMLEASFGKKVPFPKTPGFSILTNILSTNKGLLFKIIMKLLAEHGGANGVQECNKMISSESLARSLFRETPPNLASTKNSMDFHAQQRQTVLDEAAYKEALSTVQQSMLRPINPLLLISCSDGGCSDKNEKGASLDDAVLWRERTLVMSLRILCAAAAREEAFVQSMRNSTASLSIVPTLLFKGPIHGSMTHRFVDEHRINVSKMTQLLTSSSSALHRTNRSNEILPVIAEYVGYNACSLVNPQGIAASSFSIISYVSHGMTQAECIRSLCGDDINGVGLTRAFSKGLSLPVPDADDGANLRDAILTVTPKNSARDWALAWNMFVKRSCACSHVSQAWSDLARTAFICYPVFLNMTEQVEQNMAMNKRVVLEMLCAILLRLLSPSHFDALAQYSFLPGITEGIVAEDIVPECAMPLCNTVLSLTEVLLEPSSAEDDANGPEIVEEDTARVCMLIIGAISSCAGNEAASSSNDLCGALLSCALARVLTTSETWCIVSENMPSRILELYANATSYLFNISASPVYASQDRYSNAHDLQRGNIALAARSGLSSLFGHLNSLETDDSMVELFCSKLFTLESVRKSASRLSQLIAADDNYVADLLQQIVLLHSDGARLLAKSGITSELLSFAHSYATEEKKYLASHMGVSGAASLKSPPALNGHLSLLNVLLSSPLPSSDRTALAIDTMKTFKEYSRAGERLLQSYPAETELTTIFLETLYLTYSSLQKAAGSVLVENSPAHVDEPLLKLERSVLSLTYHLSAFPFPSELLPPLPIGLINVEKIHASQMKTVATTLSVVSTWWDKVSDSGAPLPTPPTGSSDAGVLQRYNAYNNRPGSTFSEGRYQHAIKSAKCLDVALMILLSRVAFVAKRNTGTFSVDAVAVAKGLCRCSDASRAIEDRLASMKSHPEEDITTLLSSSIVNPNSQGDQTLLSQSLQLEKEYLVEVGSCLGQCAEKLISLALQDARRMSEYENDQEWAYFVGALTPALDHTQVESKGVGCLFDDTNTEASKLNAQALRQELEKMKAIFLR